MLITLCFTVHTNKTMKRRVYSKESKEKEKKKNYDMKKAPYKLEQVEFYVTQELNSSIFPDLKNYQAPSAIFSHGSWTIRLCQNPF